MKRFAVSEKFARAGNSGLRLMHLRQADERHRPNVQWITVVVTDSRVVEMLAGSERVHRCGVNQSRRLRLGVRGLYSLA